MSVLSTEVIRERLAATGDARLVVAPLLDPDEQLRPGQASIDVRLGSRFHIQEATFEGVIDTVREPTRRVPSVPRFVRIGEGIVLHPHQLLLGETLEFVRLPRDLMAYVVGRSAWGRDGLIVATAVGVHPSFAGPIVLELRNLGEVPIRLYPGDPVAQLFLHKVDLSVTATTNPTVQRPSKFAGARAPGPGAHRYKHTEEKLRSLLESTRRTGASPAAPPETPPAASEDKSPGSG